MQQVGEWNGAEGHGTPHIAGDHDRTPAQPVSVDAGDQTEGWERQVLEHAQQADLERTGMEHQDGDRGHGQQRDLAAHATDGLATPEFEEVRVPPEAAAQGELHARDSLKDPVAHLDPGHVRPPRMRVSADDLVAELLIELAVPRQLAADADPNFGNAFAAAVRMDPFHQRPADTASLKRGIDGDAAHVEVVRASLETQARDGPTLQPGQETMIPSQVLSHIVFGLADRAAGRIEPAVSAECQARQAMDFRCRLRAAPPDLKIFHDGLTNYHHVS